MAAADTDPLADMDPPADTDSPGWTPFEAAVVEVLGRVGPGELVTYGEVAAEAGYPGAARAVGNLLSRSGDAGLCWWRVIAASGRLHQGCQGDRSEQARRLRAEGIEVRNSRVRLSRADRR